MGEDVLLTGDLRGGDPVEQAVGTVGDEVGGDGEVVGVDPVDELGDVLAQLVGVLLRLLGSPAALSQVLLDPVEDGPLLAVLEIDLTQVDAGIQVVGEGLGDRLDALVVDTGGANRDFAVSRSPSWIAWTKVSVCSCSAVVWDRT